MPIYSYRCNECQFAQDILQKMSDPIITVCPSCGKPEFKKQVTAAGFQLKGSGWYATDFKGAGSKNASATSTDSSKNGSDTSDSPKPDSAKLETSTISAENSTSSTNPPNSKSTANSGTITSSPSTK